MTFILYSKNEHGKMQMSSFSCGLLCVREGPATLTNIFYIFYLPTLTGAEVLPSVGKINTTFAKL